MQEAARSRYNDVLDFDSSSAILKIEWRDLGFTAHVQPFLSPVALTGEKCLRRRRAKNHVVGFRECYWFLVRKCSREGNKNGRRLRVDRLVVFLPF